MERKAKFMGTCYEKVETITLKDGSKKDVAVCKGKIEIACPEINETMNCLVDMYQSWADKLTVGQEIVVNETWYDNKDDATKSRYIYDYLPAGKYGNITDQASKSAKLRAAREAMLAQQQASQTVNSPVA